MDLKDHVSRSGHWYNRFLDIKVVKQAKKSIGLAGFLGPIACWAWPSPMPRFLGLGCNWLSIDFSAPGILEGVTESDRPLSHIMFRLLQFIISSRWKRTSCIWLVWSFDYLWNNLISVWFLRSFKSPDIISRSCLIVGIWCMPLKPTLLQRSVVLQWEWSITMGFAAKDV